MTANQTPFTKGDFNALKGREDLREYQHLIVRHITRHKRCNVYVPMGMGKSISTLTALEDINLLTDVYPVLILAPLRVAKSTWPNEIRDWTHTKHLRCSPIIGDVASRLHACNTKADVYTTNYENIPWLVEHFGERWPFRTVIADEASRLKNFRTRQGGVRTKALGTVAHTKVKRFVNLTGTPASNGLVDLWGSNWFVDAGKRLGRSFTAFRDRWFQRSFDGYGSEPLEHAQAQIEDAIHDVTLTLKAEDWFDIKEPIVYNRYIELPTKVRQMYKDMETEMFMEIEGHEIEAFNAAARTQKLLQVASGAVYVDPLTESDDDRKRSKEWKTVHDLKIEELESIIEEAAGMPVLVAYHFKSDLARLLKHFKQGRALDSKSSTISDWNKGKIPILFAHPASAGHGLNMQHGGNILVFFSHDWSLENRLQIIERIGPVRQLQSGYNRPVFIYNIVAKNTADEMVIARVENKKTIQEIFLEALKQRGLR
jgi:SNF2 family DNA or RNA helicase